MDLFGFLGLLFAIIGVLVGAGIAWGHALARLDAVESRLHTHLDILHDTQNKAVTAIAKNEQAIEFHDHRLNDLERAAV